MTSPEDKSKTPGPKPHESGLRAAKKAAKKTDNVREIGSGSSSKKAEPKKEAPAKKAPAKKAAAEKPPAPLRDPEHPWYTHAGYAAKNGQRLYEATGASGQISVRSSAQVLTHAISWGDPDRPGERAQHIRVGVISDFYSDEKSAQRAAEKRLENYPDHKIVVVPVREYRGQPGDKK